MNYAIVVVAYNRPDSLRRVLESIGKAEFFNDKVDLIISIDFSGIDEVENVANLFQWSYGEKKIVLHRERLGLRKHVLSCGDFLTDYDAIAVLEDDLVVSKSFYSYMREAVPFFYKDANIAGISLYKHRMNTTCRLPFEPEESEYDNYFMQFAQSWGQIWMKDQWFEFKKWYNEEQLEDFDDLDIPENISKWSEKSWLKYHIKYCIKKNKFFVYPYQSLSTCCADAGEHVIEKNSLFQVPLLNGLKTNYHFINLNECKIRYDSFFERIMNIPETTIDLYGTKRNYLRYVISSRNLGYKTIKTYSIDFRPQEINILNDVGGCGFYLYDTTQKNSIKKISFSYLKYILRLDLNVKILLKFTFSEFFAAIKRKLWRKK